MDPGRNRRFEGELGIWPGGFFFPKFQVLKKGEKSQKTKIHFECHPGMPRVGVDDGGFTSGCLYTL